MPEKKKLIFAFGNGKAAGRAGMRGTCGRLY